MRSLPPASLQYHEGRGAILADRPSAAVPFLVRALDLLHDDAAHDQVLALLQVATGSEHSGEG